MKELSIEEKARRYDEVVNKLKGFMAQGVDPLITRADAQDFFPELKENEDERIRKSLATYFANFKPDYMWDDDFSFGDIVVWLEKQGGHAKFINGIQVGDKVTRNEDGVLFNLSQLNRVAKKQGEQKEHDVCDFCEQHGGCIDPCSVKLLDKYGMKDPADKIEQKFYEGNWLIYENGSIYYVNKVYEHTYELVIDNGDKPRIPHELIDKKARLWTIQDAKDGDVLCCESGWTCIFKTLDSDNMSFSSYCFMDNTGWFCETGIEAHTLEKAFIKAYNGNIYPATKEQHDLLFQKMKEDGYEWDADKKELKKIEPKKEDTSELTPFEAELFSMMSDAWQGYQLGEEVNIAEIVKEHSLELLERANKQNPAWSEEDKQYLKIEGYENLSDYEKIFDDIADRYVRNKNQKGYNQSWYVKERAAEMLYQANKELKKKESWSEEDGDIRDNIIRDLKRLGGDMVSPNQPYQKEIQWLKSLKERVLLQPKQKWNQENTDDLTDFENAMMHIGNSFFGDNAGLDPNDTNAIKEQAKLLLELVPSKEWSEEDEYKYNTILHHLDLRKEKYKKECNQEEQDRYQCLYDWFKSLRPQNTWKPSDEQMELLREVQQALLGKDCHNRFVNFMYELKRLREE